MNTGNYKFVGKNTTLALNSFQNSTVIISFHAFVFFMELKNIINNRLFKNIFLNNLIKEFSNA
tara:strand:+ start:1240 stop:1428 length:189 start_codon:yes stop_codon:yes gene_type:complete